MVDKQQLRSYIKKILTDKSEDTYNTLSVEISNRLLSLLSWKQANTIAITISRGREVDTATIILQAWKENKTVVIPKCDPESKEMVFRSIKSFDQLEKVYFGLMEPKITETDAVSAEDIDLVIVPGICFDKTGYRIGYGGGYYDRYLMNFKKETISLAFSCQIVDSVPKEDHDLPVDKIITEEGVIKCDA